MKQLIIIFAFILLISCDTQQISQGKPIVVLTFDDCNESTYDAAFPIMQAYGFAGTNIACSGFIGTSGYFNWEELAEMEEYGWETASHTINHTNLINLSVDEAEAIILADLDNFHSHSIYPEGFALPCGLVNADVYEMLCRHFIYIRNSMDTINYAPIDPKGIGYYPIQSSYSSDEPVRRLHTAISRGECMVILGFHRILENNGNHPDNCTPANFIRIMEEIKSLDLEVVTLKEALEGCK